MPLIVKPISAMLVKDFDWIGKSDPYCVISVGNENQRTKTCNGGGKTPRWFDTLQFNSNANLLRVQVYDHDTFSRDDFIGEGTLQLNQYYNNPWRTQNEYIDLINRGKSAGRVLLSIQYQGQGQQMGGWSGNQGYLPNQGNWSGNRGYMPNQGGWSGNQGWGPSQGSWGGNYFNPGGQGQHKHGHHHHSYNG